MVDRNPSLRTTNGERVRKARPSIGAVAKDIILGTLLMVLIAPSLIVIVMSFTDATYLEFPISEWSTRQYAALFESELWLSALRLSVEIGLVVALAALMIGVPFVFGLHRSKLPRLPSLEMMAIGPLVLPSVAYAVALFGVFASIGLISTRLGIVMAHTVIAVPFVILIVGSAISRIPLELEQAAMGLGATRFRAYRDITLRLLAPALLGAGLLGFFASFDEVVLVSFLAGPGVETLPLEIFHSLLFGVDPVISAISASLIAISAISLAATLLYRSRS